MKKLYFLFIILTQTCYSQINNPGFETIRDTLHSLPSFWKGKLVSTYKWELDTTSAYSQKRALKLSNTDSKDSLSFFPFSQVCDIKVDTLKKIYLCAFIKSENVSKTVGLWCQLWDKDNKQIGFSSLQSQNIFIKGTTEWTKYSVSLQVNKDVKKLLLGGFLKGTGNAWFDDFIIEEATNIPSKPTSKEAIRFIEKAISIVRKNSLYSDSIDWNTATAELKILSAGAQKTSDCYDAIQYLITLLRKKGDNHSQFYPPEYNAKNNVENMDGRQPTGKSIDNSTGYIYVPGFVSGNLKKGNEFATQIQNIIKHIDSTNTITNWIVDLRENTGGNMYPMIAGLGPLLQEGTLGYFYNPKSKKKDSWSYTNGCSSAGIKKICKVITPYHLKNKSVKVAVLISSNTSSSGEMTAISFIGQPNVVLIGQSSGGYTTGNAPHELSDGSLLNIAGVYCMDRKQKAYLKKIEPDFKTDSTSSILDTTLEFAKKKLAE